MTTLPDHLVPAFTDLLLSLADDKLMLGHANSDWTGLGPMLEEDIASSSIAQDEIAHASALYELIADLRNTTADTLAFGRDPSAYRCATLTVIPDEFDWAAVIARRFFCDHFDRLRLQRLSHSIHEPTSSLAKRLAAEEAVHIDHVDAWLARLSDGTDEARSRIQAELYRLSDMAAGLLEPTEGLDELEEAGLYPALDDPMDVAYVQSLRDAAQPSGLLIANLPEPPRGPRHGNHSEHLQRVLHELCEVYRLAPGAAW